MRNLTFFAGLILLGNVAFGQHNKTVIGLEAGTRVTKTEMGHVGTGFGAGAFADFAAYRKLGLSTGLRFVQLNYSEGLMCTPSPDYEGSCPYIINRFYLLELPVGFNLDLSVRPNANWKVHLKGGYVLGRSLTTRNILVREEGRELIGPSRYQRNMAYTHGAEFGIELQGFATRKYMFAIGPSLRFTKLLHGDLNKVTVFGLNLKVGRNLNVK